jgi:hypothetical protein
MRLSGPVVGEVPQRAGKAEHAGQLPGRVGCVSVEDSGEAERCFRREAERHSGMNPNTIGA